MTARGACVCVSLPLPAAVRASFWALGGYLGTWVPCPGPGAELFPGRALAGGRPYLDLNPEAGRLGLGGQVGTPENSYPGSTSFYCSRYLFCGTAWQVDMELLCIRRRRFQPDQPSPIASQVRLDVSKFPHEPAETSTTTTRGIRKRAADQFHHSPSRPCSSAAPGTTAPGGSSPSA